MPEHHIEIRNLGNNDSRGPVYDLEHREGMLPQQYWEAEVARAGRSRSVVGNEARITIVKDRLVGIMKTVLGDPKMHDETLETQWYEPILRSVENYLDQDGYYYQVRAVLTYVHGKARQVNKLQRYEFWVVNSFLSTCSAHQVLEWIGLDLVKKSSGLRHRVRQSSSAIGRVVTGIGKSDTKLKKGGGGGYEQLSNSLSHSDRRMSSRQIERVYGLTSKGLASDGGHYF